MPNRLADESSPYLLQHKDNPVNWYPWSDEAFDAAKAADKPIFLSIGYSACHWCHVMAHESFEDDATAKLMNEQFVNIKVDREERPDVDAIYMSAVQAISGSGGWPMSVWLMPDGRPFYGGTYFPNSPRHGMPSFQQVLTRISEVFRESRDSLERDASNLTRAISRTISLEPGGTGPLDSGGFDLAFQAIATEYDRQWGGFGGQPKFPPSMTLEFLMRMYRRYGWEQALSMVTHTLDRMMWGGMYDQIGGGFHRYSVDNLWLVPHFEKMLYDNALLLKAYIHGYQITGKPRYLKVVEDTIAYIEREMTDPSGGFYSTQDADSEGHEGKFFIWTESELRENLSETDHVNAVLDYWGVTRGPNFEGKSILWVPEGLSEVASRHSIDPETLAAAVKEAGKQLIEVREKRVKPGRDEKILTAWNGLLIASIAEVGRVLDRPDFIELAGRSAEFVLEMLYQDGRLLRSFNDGRARFNGYLEDYSFLLQGLIELYQSSFDIRWMTYAVELAETMIEYFWEDDVGFYDTSHDHEELVARPQDVTDNATPSGTSVAVEVLLRLAILADRNDWREKAELLLRRLAPSAQGYPRAFGHLLCQLDFAISEPHEIVIVGALDSADTRALLEVVRRPYRPNQVVAFRKDNGNQGDSVIPLLAERNALDGRATAYVCKNYVCRMPVVTPADLQNELEIP